MSKLYRTGITIAVTSFSLFAYADADLGMQKQAELESKISQVFAIKKVDLGILKNLMTPQCQKTLDDLASMAPGSAPVDNTVVRELVFVNWFNGFPVRGRVIVNCEGPASYLVNYLTRHSKAKAENVRNIDAIVSRLQNRVKCDPAMTIARCEQALTVVDKVFAKAGQPAFKWAGGRYILFQYLDGKVAVAVPGTAYEVEKGIYVDFYFERDDAAMGSNANELRESMLKQGLITPLELAQ